MARRINILHGAGVIAAWEVDMLPETWIDAMTTSQRRIPRMRKALDDIEKVKARIRAQHPSFRKYRR